MSALRREGYRSVRLLTAAKYGCQLLPTAERGEKDYRWEWGCSQEHLQGLSRCLSSINEGMSLSYRPIAVKRRHNQGNLENKQFIGGSLTVSEGLSP